MEQNPLKQYFRQPSIYIKLPSNGAFYPEGTLDMPPNGELPVFPMTAMDEITYRTADALFNGSAVATVIQSCIPNIKDAWSIPGVDLDTILVAIRIASYGHAMDFDSKCPSCEEENSFSLDLRTILDSIQMADYTQTVTVGDMQIYFQPLSYKATNTNTMAQFEDQKLLDMLPEADIPEDEKLSLINNAFIKLGDLTMQSIAQSISMIKAGDEQVLDPAHIVEFVQNCDRSVFGKIRDQIAEFKKQSELQPVNVSCNSCQNQYSTPFTMDVSNFFVSDS